MITATAKPIRYGDKAKIDVTVTATPSPTGVVEVRNGGTLLGSATLRRGQASITLAKRALPPGVYTLTVSYLGSDAVAPSSTTLLLTVRAP